MTSIFLASLILFSEADLLPSTCNGLEDGVHELQLMESDSLPSINAVCSNNYLILDYSQDSNIASYFSTWKNWYPNFVGPTNDDMVSWREWFLPAVESVSSGGKISFLVSPDCNTCDLDSGYQYHDDQSSYFMVGSIYGCGWNRYGSNDCDFYEISDNEFNCHSCSNRLDPKVLDETADESDYITSGICPIQIKGSGYSFQHCEGHGLKPSLGTNGKFCVCYKSGGITKYYEKSKLLNTGNDDEKNANEEISEEISIDLNNLPHYKLTQSDFDKGPYRITKSGIYTLQENIVFNFNKGDLDNPLDNDAWWPSSDQDDDYPGASGEPAKPWYLGFFAGITIEASDVTLDLNGYEIKMAEHFYYLQRWFTCIELSNQYFRPGEGPFGSFGSDPIYASNVVVKNGKIGLSSHHGIHGNDNTNVILKNLDIYNFETHGIQLNGFNTVKIHNVNIHDNSKKVYFTAHFARIKGMLGKYRSVMLENDDGRDIYFLNRDEPTTYSEVMEMLEYKMKLVWEYVVENKTPEIGTDISKSDWEDALYTFYNKDGYFYGASVHGIFLNTFGATIFNYRMSNILHSNDIDLDNVKIYNLRHNVKENIGFANNYKKPWSDYFAAPYDATMIWGSDYIFNEYDWENPPSYSELPDYVGNTLMDAIALFDYYATKWDDRSVMDNTRSYMIDFEKTGFDDSRKSVIYNTKYTLSCGIDAMIHDVKGINAIRIDAVNNVKLNNIEIANIHSRSSLGYEVCGPYGFSKHTGNFRSGIPVQRGYAGHNLLGISIINTQNTHLNNIKIRNLVSNYGLTYGIAIWPNSNVYLNGDIDIYNLHAGHKLEEGLYTYNATPNQAPDACGILFYDYFMNSLDSATERPTYTSSYKLLDDINFNIHNINGHYGCLGSDWSSMINKTSPKNSNLLNGYLSEFVKQNYNHDDANNSKSKKSAINLFKSQTAITIYQILGITFALGIVGLLIGRVLKSSKYIDYQRL